MTETNIFLVKIHKLTSLLIITLLFAACCPNGEWVSSIEGPKIFNCSPQPEETISWTGGIDEQGNAHGYGVVTYRWDGKYQQWRGDLKNGKPSIWSADHFDEGEGTPPKIAHTKPQVKTLQQSNPKPTQDNIELFKGLLALGGGAFLASEGVDAAGVSAFATDVMTDSTSNSLSHLQQQGSMQSQPLTTSSNGSVTARKFTLTPKHADCFGSSVAGIKSVTIHSADSISINGISSTAQKESVTESGKSVSATLVERIGSGTAVHRFQFTFTGSNSGTYSYSNNATNKVCRGTFTAR